MAANRGSSPINAIKVGATDVQFVRRGAEILWQRVAPTATIYVFSSPGLPFASFSGSGDFATPLAGFVGGNGIHSSTREVQLRFNKAGILRWDMAASSEVRWDPGRLIVDGVERVSVSGINNDNVNFPQLSTGTATVTTASVAIVRFTKDNTVSAGQDRVNVNSLYVANAPGVPTGLAGTAAATSVSLAWVTPTSDGDSPITDYAVEFGPDTASYTAVTRTPSTAATQTVTGLTPETEYVFRVAAVNAVGTGSFTSPITRTTLAPTVPGAPTGLTATPDGYGYGYVTLAWTAPADDGGAAITDYTIQYSSNGGTSWTNYTWSQFGTNENLYGLTVGTEYTFRVAAVNSAGTGAWSATATATP
jgi:hypothetical protein